MAGIFLKTCFIYLFVCLFIGDKLQFIRDKLQMAWNLPSVEQAGLELASDWECPHTQFKPGVIKHYWEVSIDWRKDVHTATAYLPQEEQYHKSARLQIPH